jgi:hypothetical protein
VVEILRFWLAPGHGLGNAKPGVFDTGATSAYGSEYAIVSKIANDAFDAIYPVEESEFGVAITPVCSPPCLRVHRRRRNLGGATEPVSHLSYTIQYVNENCAPFDMLLSLHMNSSANPESTGVEVFYAAGAPEIRQRQAAAASASIANVLGLQDRGAKPDTKSARKRLAILRATNCPALLIEMGFVSNPTDVDAAKSCGKDALIAAMYAVRKVKDEK